MQIKQQWTNSDFKEMNWHDCHIHSIFFPSNSQGLVFEIDYLFKWELNKKNQKYKFWVSPCTLTFENTLYLKLKLDFVDKVGLNIVTIKRMNERLTPNQQMLIWDYLIETDQGIIEFEATGFMLKVNKEPILSDSQVIIRSG